MNSILAIGYKTERTFEYFCSKCITEEVINIDVLDLSKVSESHCINVIEGGNSLKIIIDDQLFDFDNYYAFYNRCFYSSIGFLKKDYALSKVVSAVNSYLESTSKPVVNKHSSGAHNGNKFIHTEELKKFGFTTLRTFICGSKDQLLEVYSKQQHLINKSCSSFKTVAAKVDDVLLNRADLLENCPSLFQEQITGPDVRIHLVGEQLFAEKILSPSIDYRYNKDKQNEYSSIEIPEQIQDLCVSYCKKENLLFSGIDFKIDSSGKWYSLEVNPMPGYEGYDKRANGIISTALFNLFRKFEVANADSHEQLFVSFERRPDVQAT